MAAFRYALRRFLHFSEEAAQSAGLTPQQHQALLAIKGYPGRECVTVGELAERLQIRHHSAVELVDRLAAENLVARSTSAKDRRLVLVQLTRGGGEVLERLSAAHTEQLKTLGPELILRLEEIVGGRDRCWPELRECAGTWLRRLTFGAPVSDYRCIDIPTVSQYRQTV